MSSFYSFSQNLMSTYCVPTTMLGSETITVNWTDVGSSLMELNVFLRREGRHEQKYKL